MLANTGAARYIARKARPTMIDAIVSCKISLSLKCLGAYPETAGDIAWDVFPFVFRMLNTLVHIAITNCRERLVASERAAFYSAREATTTVIGVLSALVAFEIAHYSERLVTEIHAASFIAGKNPTMVPRVLGALVLSKVAHLRESLVTRG
eukprot:gnl/MRDRNA2_/MRDRNA2_294577_c0_seq1.p1 gnl/MRDRNA2_/MRDRNA2_294577_c0~~gnl/MRDRNA2_/MRDRNA2_294577_c0_seq1.p1  ORF type:complete len:151 (+),score=17.74 gnl/MRDRNA2_/MRDRNA2_294577_c0_seq1:69-521(+)